jgi:hypothetical protein
LKIVFFIFIICALCAAFTLFPGKVFLDNGTRDSLHSFTSLDNLFSSLLSEAGNLQTLINAIDNLKTLSLPNCQYSSQINPNIQNFIGVIDDFSNYVSPTQSLVEEFTDTFRKWTVDKRAQAVYIIFVFSFIVISGAVYSYIALTKSYLQVVDIANPFKVCLMNA